jgi:uncharacterized protein YdhG (YjbR/CyaY superfamily)
MSTPILCRLQKHYAKAHCTGSSRTRRFLRLHPLAPPSIKLPNEFGDSPGFTDEERAAMKERAQELKAEARSKKDRAEGESALLAKIAEMPEPDRAMAERLHAIVTTSAPDLSPKTWYGMPAYAKDGKVVCFFQGAGKFDSRYATLRLQRHGEPRRRAHVADLLRAEGVDCRRRGKRLARS